MLKRILLIILICCMIMSSSGCWDAVDVNSLSLITLVITDRQDGQFIFYVELPNLTNTQGQEGGGGNEQYSTISSRGDTFTEARADLDAQLDKAVFLGTVRSLIVTNELSRFGIEWYMFRLQTMVDYRKALSVITTFTKPEDIISVKPENNVSVGFAIDELINSLDKLGRIVNYNASDILEFLYSDTSFVMLNVDVKEDKMAVTGYSIMKEGKYLDFIPYEKSKGLAWLLADNPVWRYSVPFEDALATVEVTLKKRTIKPYYKDGKLSLDLNFSFDSSVMYLNKNIKLTQERKNSIQEEIKNLILSDIADTIGKSKSVACEYLGFKNYFRIKYPQEIKTINWLETYLASDISISVNYTLETEDLMIDFAATGRG